MTFRAALRELNQGSWIRRPGWRSQRRLHVGRKASGQVVLWDVGPHGRNLYRPSSRDLLAKDWRVLTFLHRRTVLEIFTSSDDWD